MNKLAGFLAEKQLAPEIIPSLRSQFLASPVGLASVDGFLKVKVADAIHTFLAEKATYADRYGSFAEGEVTEERWRSLPDHERMFHFFSMAAPQPGVEMDPATLTFLRLRHAVKTHIFDQWFGEITGVTIKSATTPHAHRYHQHHFLRTHTDNRDNRKLAVIIYLTKNFDASSGGCLALAKNGAVLERVRPEFNKLVFFDVTKNEHYIEPFTSEASGPRMSLGWWFQT